MRVPQDMGRPLPGNIEALRGRNDPEAIKAAAKEMEALFAYEMIKAMRETAGPSPGGLGGDAYGSMFDMELSRILAERGLGLTEMLTRHLSEAAGNTAGPEGREPAEKTKNSGFPAEAEAFENDGYGLLLPSADGARISSGYGMRNDPISGERKFHHGIDIAAPEGSEIHPVKAGKVQFSGERPGYGNVVVIDHEDGYTSTYAHNQVNLVHEGDTVDAGTVIALVGSSGRSTGPHVHVEAGWQGRHIDPKTLLAMR